MQAKSSSQSIGQLGSKHLTDVSIERFRGLENIELQETKRINLLVGGNNSGKTSVLEAIQILNCGPSISEWFDVARMREVRTYATMADSMSFLDAICWMFPAGESGSWEQDGAGDISIRAETALGSHIMRASFNPIRGFLPEELVRQTIPTRRVPDQIEPIEDNGIELSIWSRSPKLNLLGGDVEERFQIWSQLGYRSVRSRRRTQSEVRYLSPYGHRNSSNSASELSRYRHSSRGEGLSELLSKLDPRIEGVEIVTNETGRYPRIAIRMTDGKLLPLAVMGDGIRRALSISLAILSSRGSILLIDEIEAGFHIGAFEKVYGWLVWATEQFDVQVFATTHSLEAIDAIATASANNHDLCAYSIARDGNRVAKRFTGGMLQRMVVDGGLDIRG
jgi:hypothetical protein